MITESTLYWITRLDGIKGFLGGFTGVFVLITFVSIAFVLIYVFVYRCENNNPSFKFIWVAIIPFVIGTTLGLANVFTPTTKVPANMGLVILDEDICHKLLLRSYNYDTVIENYLWETRAS